MIVKAAAILCLIALSGCTEEARPNDPPDIGLAAEPVAEPSAEMPQEIAADKPSAPESASDAKSEPPMRSPVELD